MYAPMLALALAAAVVDVRATYHFMAIGDWGGSSAKPYTTPSQVDTAKSMGKVADAENTQFVLAIGDNFYSNGIQTDVHDHRFNDTFEKVYTAPSLQVPWYVVAGNHDHHATGNITAEMAYTKYSKRWNYPNLWFSVSKSFIDESGANVTMDFFLFDSIIMAGTWNNHEDQPLAETINQQLADEQVTWLDRMLTQSRADWRIVCSHYPIWSVAEHGPTKVLIQRVKPLLEKHRVPLYLNGHDHNLQLLEDRNVTYVVTGAAHAINPSKSHTKSVPKHSLKYFWGPSSKNPAYTTWEVFGDKRIESNNADGGFITAHVHSASELTLHFWNAEAKDLYTHKVKNTR